MKKILIAIGITAAALLSSCGGSTDKVVIPNDFNAENIISHQNNLQNVLTKKMVASTMQISESDIEIQIENNVNQNGQYTVTYSWQTGKKKKVGDGKFEIEEYQSLGIGFIQKMKQEDFEKYYGSSAGLQQQVDQIATKENFNKEVGMAEAQYLKDYASKQKNEKLENVASLAYWETPMNALHVLANDVVFTITTNFGDDASLAKKKSVQLVQTILNTTN